MNTEEERRVFDFWLFLASVLYAAFWLIGFPALLWSLNHGRC